MKTISLIKSVFTEDMNIFKYSISKKKGKLVKLLLPLFLFTAVGVSIGTYAYELVRTLHDYGLAFIALSIFIIIVSLLAFMEGIYKSQGILFEAKDNNLLFSMPIKKSKILFVRILKLMVFEYLYNLMFILPVFIVYIYFERPGVSFFLLFILMTFLIPIIPTVLSSIIGYLIKLISSKFRLKKIIQTLLTSLVFIGLLAFSFNTENIMVSIVKNATNINEVLTKIYYPLGLYISLINEFDLKIFIKLILINIIPLIMFIFIGEKYYFKTIFSSKSSKIKKDKEFRIRVKNPLISLTHKELSRFFSSTVYMFNTTLSLILMVVFSIILAIKGNTIILSSLSNFGISEYITLDIVYYMIASFLLLSTSITSSSISLEGSTINITKSLPVDYKKIFISKILTCYIIEMPFMLLSLLIYVVSFKVTAIFIIEILTLIIVSILLTSTLGLIINLKYPKLNASNDTEVVKQSMSSMISVFLGIGIFIVSLILIGFLNDCFSLDILLLVHLIIISLLSYIAYRILMKKGTKEYQDLNI